LEILSCFYSNKCSFIIKEVKGGYIRISNLAGLDAVVLGVWIYDDEALVAAKVAGVDHVDCLDVVAVFVAQLLVGLVGCLMAVDWHLVMVVFALVGQNEKVWVWMQVQRVGVGPEHWLDDRREWQE